MTADPARDEHLVLVRSSPSERAEPGDEVTALALRARDGDPVAARELVHATWPDVWRLVAFLGERSAADDLAQETYERAFAALPAFRAAAPARSWLLSIARRTVADHVRRAQRRPRTSPGDDLDDRPATSSGADHAEAVALQDLLDTLLPERREAFVLTQQVGLGYQEAADVVGCPVGTIRSRVARARADLIDALQDRPPPTRPGPG